MPLKLTGLFLVSVIAAELVLCCLSWSEWHRFTGNVRSDALGKQTIRDQHASITLFIPEAEITGMLLMWTFAEVSERPYWKAMSWAMLPSLVSAMCACTWHFFYNAPELEWLVALQAGFTVLGNIALWWGAYHVFKQSQAQASGAS